MALKLNELTVTNAINGGVTGNASTATSASFATTAATALNVGNGTITIAAGTGVGVGTTNTFTTNQSGATTVTISNSGVTSNVAGSGISLSGGTGAVTITNSGVTSAVAGTGISVSGATGAVTISVANGVYTNGNNTFTGTNVQNSPNNTFVNTVTNANQSLTFYQATSGADAYMTFHIGSDFAGYFGLGGAENDLVWGGWSVGNYRYRILHSGNASYAWNMNQNVRTTDSPTFSTVTATLNGNAATATSATNATTATSAGCINSDTGNVGGNRLQYWQTSGNTALNPDGEWYNAIRMGHGDPVTYYSNTLAVRMTGGNLGDIYTRTTTNGATGSWNRFWHNNNDGAGSGLDADLLDGYGSATANTANTIVLRDGSGNFSAGTITAALSGNATTATSASFATTAATATNVTIANGSVTLAKIENITAYTILGNSNASAAATPAALSVATVATMLSGQTMNIAGSSTSCSGNAATATSISGFNNPVTAATANTIAYRDANGDLSARYFFGSYQNSSDDINTGNISHIMAKFGDNYHRSATAAKVAAFISGQTMNIAGSSTSCTGNAATATNATTAGGLAVQTGTNYDANKIVRTDGNGYILAGWINTISGDNGTTAIDRVYASNDGYIRYYTPANFRTVLDVPTRNGSGVTNFGINTAPSNRLHINGDGTNPAIRVDNGAVVLAASAASNSKTFYGWLPISIAGTTKWIQMYN
jgi:hypothetical protein